MSARTGAGLDDLRAALDRAAARVVSRAAATGPLRLHVDRVVHRQGRRDGGDRDAVVGRGARAATRSRSCPSGRRARVRSVQVHDAPVDAARRRASGSRSTSSALGRDEVARGDVVVAGAGRAGADLPGRRASGLGGPGTARGSWSTTGRARRRRAPSRSATTCGSCAWRRRSCRSPATGSSCARSRRRTRSAAASWSTPAPRAARDARAARAGARRRSRAPRPAAPALPPLTDSALRTEERAAHARPRRRTPSCPRRDLAALRAHGRAVRIGPGQHFHADVLADVAAARRRPARGRGLGHARARARRARLLAQVRRRRCSSTSTPSGSRSAAATSGCCGAAPVRTATPPRARPRARACRSAARGTTDGAGGRPGSTP